MRGKLFCIGSLILCIYNYSYCQDKLILNSGDVLNGKVEGMTENVLTFSTPYSDSDFKVEWKKVDQLFSPRIFFLIFSDKETSYSRLNYSGKVGNIILTNDGLYQNEYAMEDIVLIDPAGKSFSSAFDASLSIGYTLTKENNNQQGSLIGNFGYTTPRYYINARFNFTGISQEGAEDIDRSDGGIRFRYLFVRNWFAALSTNFFSNSEQNIDLRNIITPSVGNYLIRNNILFFSLSGGINFNAERFRDDTPSTTSLEGYIRGEFKAIDIKDLNFYGMLEYFPGITRDRDRITVQLDFKYDLPYDLFIKFGYSLNFDSEPPNDSPRDDFVFQTTLGWEY